MWSLSSQSHIPLGVGIPFDMDTFDDDDPGTMLIVDLFDSYAHVVCAWLLGRDRVYQCPTGLPGETSK